ncbi:hypothetical protein HDF26_002396 [Pedobacter cryoconitis]|uniref:Uncharacterized protein n=1 Tax=Pedobacter cryoconitis TaxID=188932 RepID=A0A7W9DXH9_9SPHI|nr:hypothetical protein [Pedobacter cryoconitis]MBB5634928.1 hypothetical protein [Pedobacter cryoconitis]MBB6271939.1 hypothetical protein [Pedobacter cryoconitis]
MLTRFTAILLLMCSVSVSLSGLFVFAGFEMNEGYIAKELCVNKDKPQLHCNGKCYLMKKLKQAEEKEQKQDHQFQKIQLQEPVVYAPFEFKQYAVNAISLRVPFTTGKPVAQLTSIFHPPQLSC